MNRRNFILTVASTVGALAIKPEELPTPRNDAWEFVASGQMIVDRRMEWASVKSSLSS